MAGDKEPFVRYLAGFVIISCLLTSTNAQFRNWNEYIQAWRREQAAYAAKMYPFLERFGDTKNPVDERQIGANPEIQFTIPYFGDIYRSAWISPSGHVSLWLGTTPNGSYFNSVRLPNPNYPQQQDFVAIAPFYTDGRFELDDRQWSDHFYRVLDERKYSDNVEKEVVRETLKMISMDIREYVPGANRFHATYGLVVTWYQQRYFGARPCDNLSCPRNTYQAAILTDEAHTYVVYNYYQIKWVGGISSDCDRNTGTRNPGASTCKPAQAGFNRGHGQGFHGLPYSGQNEIIDIDTRKFGKVPGRYMFKLSNERVVRGGCTNQTNIPGWSMEVFPNEGTMFGGNQVQASGYCLMPGDEIRCRFGDQVVNGTRNSMMVASCVAPFMNTAGVVRLAISVDGGNTYPQSTDYMTFALDLYPNLPVTLVNEQDLWHNIDPPNLRVTWTPRNLTEETNQRVTIQLVGYRRVGNRSIWEFLHTFAMNQPNNGAFEFPTVEHQCSGSKCPQYHQGFISISTDQAVAANSENPERIGSYVTPLGWFYRNAMQNAYGGSWPETLCRQWAGRQNAAWVRNIQPCPCTLSQALVDFGRWMPDPDCSLHHTSPNKCQQHQGAQHCVRSVQPSHPEGSGMTCCYNEQRGLMYAQDSVNAGTGSRAHVLGTHTGSHLQVPTMSHWDVDVIPHIQCCRWSSTTSCATRYMTHRPTKNCREYVPPKHATTFGDPHFQTFDGNVYTFNGKGEFHLVMVDNLPSLGGQVNFRLQGRFEQPENRTWGEVKATWLTAVAMHEGNPNTEPRVEVKVTPQGNKRKLRILINGSPQDMVRGPNRLIDLGSVKLINNNAGGDMSQSNITVMFRSGVGIQVANPNKILHVMAAVPPEAMGRTKGLYGVWNGDKNDDLQPPSGPAIQPDPSNGFRNLYTSFGVQWRVAQADSLFEYYQGQNWAYFNDLNFKPHFGPPVVNQSLNWRAVCGASKECEYDYKSTLNRDIAQGTRHAQMWFGEMVTMSAPTNSCGILNVPNSLKDSHNYSVGSQVRVTGCHPGYRLQGHSSYTCVNGDPLPTWSPQVTARCLGSGAAPNTAALAAAIAVPIVLIVLIAIFVIGFLVFRRRQKANGGEPSSKPPVPPEPVKHIPPPQDEAPRQVVYNTHHGSQNSLTGSQTRVRVLPTDPTLPGQQRSRQGSLTGSGAGVPVYDRQQPVNMQPGYSVSQENLYSQHQYDNTPGAHPQGPGYTELQYPPPNQQPAPHHQPAPRATFDEPDPTLYSKVVKPSPLPRGNSPQPHIHGSSV